MDVEVVRLRDAFAVYQKPSPVALGDLVREKDGIRIGSQPRAPNNAFVVMDVRPGAETCWDLSVGEGGGAYGLRLDICLGYYDADGDFMFSWADSRRFELLPESAHDSATGEAGEQ